MTDDLDKRKLADLTRDLTFEGVVYTLDLTQAHYEELKGDLKRWMDAAHEKRRLGAKKAVEAGVVSSPSKTTKEERAKIRVWAQENGYKFASRGVIPGHIIEAWRTTQGGEVVVREGGSNGQRG